MNLDSRLLAQKTCLMDRCGMLLADAKRYSAKREEGDVASRCAAGKEASRLKKEAACIGKEIKKIELAENLLQTIVLSLNLRQATAHYHYSNWLEVEEKGIYAAMLDLRLGGNGYVNAVKYNAEVLAFLQNVHAICDSFPYLLNLYLRSFDFESKTIGWNASTLNGFRETLSSIGEQLLLRKLDKFCSNEDFHTLQKIVNCAKHKHVIGIYFDGSKTFLGKLNGEAGPSDLGVKEAMIKFHDSLLPLIFEMLDLALVGTPDKFPVALSEASRLAE